MPKPERHYWYAHHESYCYGVARESELPGCALLIDILGPCEEFTYRELIKLLGVGYNENYSKPSQVELDRMADENDG